MTHLGTLTKGDKDRLAKQVELVEHFIEEVMIPLNEDHLDACIDYIVTKLVLYKESDPFHTHLSEKYQKDTR